MLFRLLAVLLIAYLCGCVNGAIIISRIFFHTDVREKGSGNAGLTNFQRNFGMKLVPLVLLLDLGKAFVSVSVAGKLLSGTELLLTAKVLAMLFTILGHMFPVFFCFRGGKGVLTGVGALIVLDWRLAAILFSLFCLIVLLTRYVSLGSVVVSALLPFLAWALGYDLISVLLLGLCGGMVVFMHRANIRRLIRGEESRLKFKK